MKILRPRALIRIFSYCSGVYQSLRERSVRLKLSTQAAWSQPIRSRIERYVVLAFAILGSPFMLCFSVGTPAETQPEPDLVVVAKLVAIEPARGCGMFHFAEVAEYMEISVFKGVWSSDRLRVVHGCTEPPRSQYESSAGTLERFTVGDYHRLELTMQDIYKTGHRLRAEDNASVADYYALRVDLALTPEAARNRSRNMTTISREELVVALNKFTGKICSGYLAGGAVGSLITLEFEPRVLRPSPLRNKHLSDLQRETEAQFAIFIKCVWRLDSLHEVVCGAWDDNSPDGPMLRGLKNMVGRPLRSFSLTDVGLDLCLDFGDLCLRVFCDQVNELDENDNYIIFLPEEILTVATRSRV